MVEEDTAGIRPLYRSKNYDVIARRREKQRKLKVWSNRGGYIAPNSELANSLKTIADSEAEAGIRFRIVETGGRTVKSILQKSNPTATVGCEEGDCLPCRPGRGEGGDCRRCGVNHSIGCQLCPKFSVPWWDFQEHLHKGIDHE